MNGQQQSLDHATTARVDVWRDAGARRPYDDDVALGCECADPVLQIERWSQEAPRPLRELY